MYGEKIGFTISSIMILLLSEECRINFNVNIYTSLNVEIRTSFIRFLVRNASVVILNTHGNFVHSFCGYSSLSLAYFLWITHTETVHYS